MTIVKSMTGGELNEKYNFPEQGTWKKPEREEQKDVIEVRSSGGTKYRFLDAFVKKITVDGESWYSIRDKEDGHPLFHFATDRVETITIDGVPFNG